MFKEPVEVLPNVNYTACATLKVRFAEHNNFSTFIKQTLSILIEVPYFITRSCHQKKGDWQLFRCSDLYRHLGSSRVQTHTMALKACGRSPTSPQDLAPKPASPSAMPPATTTALLSRTDRSQRSSSTHNDHLVLPYSRSFLGWVTNSSLTYFQSCKLVYNWKSRTR